MGEAFIVRRGGVSSEETAAPTITIISETNELTFTLTNNDDNTALITFEIDDQIGGVELAAAAVSANITVALAGGTYTLTAFATVVGEVATQSIAAVEIVVILEYEELFELDVTTATTEIDITGLSIGKADTLRLVWTFFATTTISAIRIFANGNNTVTNYHRQFLGGSGSSTFAGRANDATITQVRGSDLKPIGFVDIKVSNNDRFVAQCQSIQKSGGSASGIEIVDANIVGSGFTLTSITSLKIVSVITNGIGIGSKIQLYKVTEAA